MHWVTNVQHGTSICYNTLHNTSNSSRSLVKQHTTQVLHGICLNSSLFLLVDLLCPQNGPFANIYFNSTAIEGGLQGDLCQTAGLPSNCWVAFNWKPVTTNHISDCEWHCEHRTLLLLPASCQWVNATHLLQLLCRRRQPAKRLLPGCMS